MTQDKSLFAIFAALVICGGLFLHWLKVRDQRRSKPAPTSPTITATTAAWTQQPSIEVQP